MNLERASRRVPPRAAAPAGTGGRPRVRTPRPGRRRFGRIPWPMLFWLGCVVEVGAQPSTRPGWVFGIESGAASVSLDGGPGDGAALVGGRIGRDLNGVVTPYLGLAYADVRSRGLDAFDRLTFAHVDLGARLRFAAVRRRWVPYGDLALTFRPVRDVVRNGKRTGADFTGGPVFSGGGGLAVHLSEAWALDVNVKAGRGAFRDVPADGTSGGAGARIDFDAASVRLGVGVSWRP